MKGKCTKVCELEKMGEGNCGALADHGGEAARTRHGDGDGASLSHAVCEVFEGNGRL